MPATVVIVGGRGEIGQETALGLIRCEGVGRIVLADRRTGPSGLRERLKLNPKIALAQAEATDEKAMAGLLSGADLAVNCAGPFGRTLVPVARAALAARVHCLDVCDDWRATAGLLNSGLDQEARKAGITLLTGMGSDPGTNNLLAKWYADQLDRVDEAELSWAAGLAGMGGAALTHCLDMVEGQVPQFLDGELRYVDGGSGEQTVIFSEPAGACLARRVGHPQPLTLPAHLPGLRRLEVKGAVLPDWADRLIMARRDTGHPGDPAPDSWRDLPAGGDLGPETSALQVVVRGERGGRPVTFTADLAGSMGPGTALPAAIAARMLLDGEITARGVLPPEACVPPGRFLGLLVRAGAVIRQTVSTLPGEDSFHPAPEGEQP